jgi:hypothetical protein
MANITVDETRLEELIEKAVQKHLKLKFEDMEEVRRSPAAAIVRLETRLDDIEKVMATKADIANLRSEFSDRIGTVARTLGERIGDVEKTLVERISRLESSNKFMIAMLLSIFGAVVATLVKLFFL